MLVTHTWDVTGPSRRLRGPGRADLHRPQPVLDLRPPRWGIRISQQPGIPQAGVKQNQDSLANENLPNQSQVLLAPERSASPPPHIWINENKRRFNEHTRFRHLFLTSVTSLLREPHLTVALHPCSSRDNVRTDVEGL